MWTTTPSWTARGWPSAAAVAHVVRSARNSAESHSAGRMMTHDPSRALSGQCPEFDTPGAGPGRRPRVASVTISRVGGGGQEAGQIGGVEVEHLGAGQLALANPIEAQHGAVESVAG